MNYTNDVMRNLYQLLNVKVYGERRVGKCGW